MNKDCEQKKAQEADHPLPKNTKMDEIQPDSNRTNEMLANANNLAAAAGEALNPASADL